MNLPHDDERSSFMAQSPQRASSPNCQAQPRPGDPLRRGGQPFRPGRRAAPSTSPLVGIRLDLDHEIPKESVLSVTLALDDKLVEVSGNVVHVAPP